MDGRLVLRDGEDRVLLDPWKRPYVYVEPTPEHPLPRVLSLGADGMEGGEGEDADIDSDQLSKEER
ncbi:MAG: type II secretion system protein GspG [Planctomycetes bacterium]|nr:type II secretion system protein GspG [Planctomycetota bacterium]